MAQSRTVPVILLGLGNVGGVLLRQIVETQDAVQQRVGVKLLPIGLADISGVVFAADGLSEDVIQGALNAAQDRQLLDSATATRPLDDLAGLVHAGAIVADVTAARQNVPLLKAILAAGGGAALANKNPMTGAWSETAPLFTSPKLRYECTVGAGLPVIANLQALLDTGDEPLRIEGCLSGTLGYLCAELERGVAYGDVIAQAHALGYTEPDPRDDLSGHDVARKALILARTAGWPLEMADLTVEPLYNDELAALSREDFMTAAHSLDAEYAERFAQAKADGQTLRYVAQVTATGGMVKLEAVAQDSPMGTLRGPANYISLQTARYEELPMVISGPGAGPDVTAAGVLSDILKLAVSA